MLTEGQVQLTLLPMAAYAETEVVTANRLLVEWGHYLGVCNRPFGKQAFALYIGGEPVGIAVSASTVSSTLAGGHWHRRQVVELARLCSKPGYRDLTRVTLRLWRTIAPVRWSEVFWPVKACVAYSDTGRHPGHIYRTDGWSKLGTNPGSSGGGTWTKKRVRQTPKTLWTYELQGGTAAGGGHAAGD